MRTKHKTTLFKRLGAWVLTLALVVGLLPQTAFAAETDTGKAIQLVDSGTAANISGAQADNIYFGTYRQSSDGNSGYNIDPIKWRVLENANGQLFLLSDQNLDVFQYHVDYESVTWATSTMRSWLNGYGAAQNTGSDNGIDYTDDNFIDTAFSDGEQGATGGCAPPAAMMSARRVCIASAAWVAAAVLWTTLTTPFVPLLI